MALFGFYDYEKAGKGVSKNEPKKKSFFAFWELYFRYSWRLMKLNMLTFLFCIPIVTIGPALAGMTKVLRNYTLDKSAFIFHEFWKGFSQNWKKSLPIGLLDTLFTISAVTAAQVYPQLAHAAEEAGKSGTFYMVLCVISVSFALTLLMMNFYIMPMIIATELSLKDIVKNSFFLSCVALKKNVVTLIIVALIAALFVIFFAISPPGLLLLPVWGITFTGFVIMYNSYPQIQKYVINPYYEERGMDNPEYDYLKPLSEEDSVFTDMGGKEAATESKKNKKGKIIS